jgi:dTDP-glucose pyrophosphorylase/predicted transcriptional regulator
MSSPKKIWKKAILSVNTTIDEAIQNLNKNAIKIVLVVNDAGSFEGTITDGDIRRGLLKGLNMKSQIDSILNRSSLVVSEEIEREMVLQLMTINKIQQIPILNESHKVVGLHLWDEIVSPNLRENFMVIMVGGMGKRLSPFTESCPKPLLKVSGKPILEHIIERAKFEGFNHFVLAIHYLGEMIEDYFGNGELFNVKIDYLYEDSPLGTAGALSLLNPFPNRPFIVTNGDVITDIRYGQLLDFHNIHSAGATMAIRVHEWQNPFGVVQTKGVEIIGFEEKPINRTHINAGVYVISPESLRFLARNTHCDMPELFKRLQDASIRTIAYPMYEPWLDIGRPDDLINANKA